MSLLSYSLLLVLGVMFQVKAGGGIEFTLIVLLLALAFFSLTEVIFLYILAGELLYLIDASFWGVEFFSYTIAVVVAERIQAFLDFSQKILIAAPLGIGAYYLSSAFYYHFFSLGDFAGFLVKNTIVFLGMFYLFSFSFKKDNLRHQINWV